MATATARLAPDAKGLRRAAELLAGGACVAFPTETVYGLGAAADDPDAVAAIYAAKDRPARNPLIVHVADAAAAAALTRWTELAGRLAERFWPGPLTLVLPRLPTAPLAPAVSAGQSSVAVRVPANPVAQALLRAVGRPLAAPSANPSGRVSPTSADHVLDGLDGRIAAVLDGGATSVGLESTILDLCDGPRVLRHGGVTVEALAEVLGAQPLAPPRDRRGALTAPGLLPSHYAPRAALRLDAETADPGEVLLGFGPVAAAANLSPQGDLEEAARNLFALLRALDGQGVARIAVSPIPETGLGLAINDRLRRAAAPRP